MPPPCALARSKFHAPPALPPPAAGVLRTAEDRFEALPGYRYAPKYADVADAEKVRGAVWRMTSVSTTTHESKPGRRTRAPAAAQEALPSGGRTFDCVAVFLPRARAGLSTRGGSATGV